MSTRCHVSITEPLQTAISKFRLAATHLDQVIRDSDLASETPLKVRKINDQLMLLDRAFLDPQAFPNEYGFRHVFRASTVNGRYTFQGLAIACAKAMTTGLASDWEKAHHHVSILSQAIAGAAFTLEDVI